MKKRIILTILLITFTGNLFSGIFNVPTDETKKEQKQDINKESEEEKKMEEMQLSKKYFLPNSFQKEILQDIKNNNWEKLKIYIELLVQKEDIKPEQKQDILNYIFDEYIELYIKFPEISYSLRNEMINFLSNIVGKLDPSNQYSELNILIFKTIEDQDILLKQKYKDYWTKYYENNGGNHQFFYKLYSFLNSNILKDKWKNIGLDYLKNFKVFLKKSTKYSETLIIQYLHFQYVNEIYGNLKDFSEKIIFNNKFNHDGHFYLGMYYREFDQKRFKEELIDSIKYNIYNSKAYLELLDYFVENKKELPFAIKLANYYLDKINEEFYNNKINYLLALAYYKKGIDEREVSVLYKSYKIFIGLQNNEMTEKTKNLMLQINEDEFLKLERQ